ncbi:putative Archaeal preflagellin peptidase FlaK [Candidatus Nitrosocaldus cavascurensis]|jgi:preflagellin peptidase FlaK|uniref:Putative Archaeal preflagellin peptidase FlaK n=2 Tax=Candidatus Nitrosocaldaceae TaxID=1968910 RepID=A0A2K5AS82_9ARCH|nr:putative Archaeal preflagellin peptidase FlaK [Candidatus Nitrosocaldus cavascurensis]
MLVVASIMDIRKREISDKVWIVSFTVGLTIIIVGLFTDNTFAMMFQQQQYIIRYALSIGITSPLAYIAYRSWLFGGADAKALIVISAILPFYEMKYSIHGIPALTILTNACMLTLVHILHNISRNTIAVIKGKDIFDGFDGETKLRKAIAFMIGFIAKRPRGYLFPIEESKGDKRMFTLSPKAYSDYVHESARDIWVTPALPFIVYMTIGFLLMLYVGDVLAYIFHSIW